MKLTKFGLKLFFLFLLVSLVPLGIAGTIVYKYVHDKTKEDALRQLRSTAYGLNGQLNLLLSKRRFRVIDFSSDGFIRDCVEQMSLMTSERSNISEKLNSHLIINKKGLDPDILEITIFNLKGKVIASTSQEQIGKDKSHENYFRVPFLSLEQRVSYFADVMERSETTDKLRLVFFTLLTEKISQRPLGVIVTKVKGDIIQGLLNQYMYHSVKEGFVRAFGEIYIVNSNRIKIADTTKSVNFNQIVDTKVVQEVLASKGEFSGTYENYKGVQVLGTALFVPEANWVILAEKNVKDAFLPLARIKYIFPIAGGGALFLVIIFSFVISNKINAILKKLIEGTRRIAYGDLEHFITIGKRKDEIKELVESFNLMMNKLRESLREKDVLLREIYHRVKNNMQVISSLLSLQSRYIKDEKYIVMFKESQNRIKVMALVHEKLYGSKDLANIDFNDYIKDLVNDLFLSYRVSTDKIVLKVDVGAVSFGVDTAIPCGLIVNELISNSLKHAFPEGKEGEIKISLRSLDEGEIELIVCDDGVGLPEDLDFRNTESLGLRLVTNLAEKQLQGKVELNRGKGAEFQIKFKEIKYKERV